MAEDKAKVKRRTLPIYAVMQIMDETGSPMQISKDNVNSLVDIRVPKTF